MEEPALIFVLQAFDEQYWGLGGEGPVSQTASIVYVPSFFRSQNALCRAVSAIITIGAAGTPATEENIWRFSRKREANGDRLTLGIQPACPPALESRQHWSGTGRAGFI